MGYRWVYLYIYTNIDHMGTYIYVQIYIYIDNIWYKMACETWCETQHVVYIYV